MLTELGVENLGVIAGLRLVLGDGMTALTGETGAGKTLIVDAIDLLAGGRADTSLVREGADEAVVEGRFVTGDDEIVVRRVVPAKGRSRAYVDGRMATVRELAEVVERHVDLYAQHAHHSLLATAGQRAALDRYAGTDLRELRRALETRRAVERELTALGGDVATREREADLLRYQLAELDAAGLDDPDEDDRLAAEQALLDDVATTRARAAEALAALGDEGGVSDVLGVVVSALAGVEPLAADHRRLHGLAAELDDAVTELRHRSEGLAEDPERLEAVVQRRQLLATLRRRHGDGTMAGLFAEHRRLAERLVALEQSEARGEALTAALRDAEAAVDGAARVVGATRRAAAGTMARAVQEELRELAMPAAEFEVGVGDDDPGDDVEMRFTANPGTRPAPLARSASGGELARTMLAVRLVAVSEQETVIFDEVDAGIGGSAAVAVGQALGRLGRSRQVLVVTHLAQVAAAADRQIGVVKTVVDGRTVTTAQELTDEDRVVELSRMLSGQPTSASARAHARELLTAGWGITADG